MYFAKDGHRKYFDQVITREQYTKSLNPSTPKPLKGFARPTLIEDNPLIRFAAARKGANVVDAALFRKQGVRALPKLQREPIDAGSKTLKVVFGKGTRQGLNALPKNTLVASPEFAVVGKQIAPSRRGSIFGIHATRATLATPSGKGTALRGRRQEFGLFVGADLQPLFLRLAQQQKELSYLFLP